MTACGNKYEWMGINLFSKMTAGVKICNILKAIEISFRRNQVNFLVYGQDSKKIESVGRQNKNNIIWSLGLLFFKN